MFRITEDLSSGSLVQCLAKKLQEWFYRVHVNGHDIIILVLFRQALYKAL
jgi:hypothetical protein